MKKALILGCSHSVGAEMFKEPGLVFDNFDQANDYGRVHCYPAQIAQALGYESINLGMSGGSNDAMFRLFTEIDLTNNDIVIACWSGINRSEIFDSQWIRLVPGLPVDNVDPDYFKYWVSYSTSTEQGMLNKIKNILALNALAQAQGIQVVNLDSFWPVTDFVWPGFVKWPVDIDFMSWCQQHNFPHTEQIHFFKPAHDSYAEHVLQNIAGRVATTPVS